MPIQTVPRSEVDALVEAGGRILEHRLEDGEPVCVVEMAEAAEGKAKNSPKSSKKSQPEVEPESEE